VTTIQYICPTGSVLQCINGVSSNPVEGRTKIWLLKNLILTLFGLIFIQKCEDTKWVITSRKSNKDWQHNVQKCEDTKWVILDIVLSVLIWFTTCDYPFGIFTLLDIVLSVLIWFTTCDYPRIDNPEILETLVTQDTGHTIGSK
jgi:hypothetical protein